MHSSFRFSAFTFSRSVWRGWLAALLLAFVAQAFAADPAVAPPSKQAWDVNAIREAGSLWSEFTAARDEKKWSDAILALQKLVRNGSQSNREVTFTSAFLKDLITGCEVARGDWKNAPPPDQGLLERSYLLAFDGSPLPSAGDSLADVLAMKSVLSLSEKTLGADHPLTTLFQLDAALAEQRAESHEEAKLAWQLAEAKWNALAEKAPPELAQYYRRYQAISRLQRAAILFAQRDLAAAETLAVANAEKLANDFIGLAQNRALLIEIHLQQNNLEKVKADFGPELTFPHVPFGYAQHDQLRMVAWMRLPLDLYLTYRGMASSSPAVENNVTYELPLLKGAGFTEQVRLRGERKSPLLAPLFTELGDVDRRLAEALAGAGTAEPSAANQELLATLTSDRVRIEKELWIRRNRLPKMQNRPPADQVPPGCVLLDFYEYEFHGPSEKKPGSARPRHLACLVAQMPKPTDGNKSPPRANVFLHDLGPAEPIAKATTAWRETIEANKTNGRGKIERPSKADEGAPADPDIALQTLLLNPLRAYLPGAETVFISPDGPLSLVPFAALPNPTTGRFLIEEFSLVVVPVPHLLTPMLKNLSTPKAERPQSLPDDRPKMLLIGGIDYGPRDQTKAYFPPLSGTQMEIDSLKATFQKTFPMGEVDALSGRAATGAAFRKSAPGCNWIHIATHGYFTRTKSPFSEAGSGLALTDANGPATAQGDGLLTALDLANLDLQGTRLMVLSACDTALGASQRGEGVRGLQSALHLAGVQTSVTSLWKIHDDATQALMREFYRNLWEGKLSRLESLRAAQLAMLRGTLYSPPGAGDLAPSQAMPPYYWAAFVLCGDWK